MIKPDFQKIIYQTDEFHRLPWLKVYDFLKLPEVHILLRACPPKYEPVHILYFSNGHLSYIPGNDIVIPRNDIPSSVRLF